jgi:hypothetical protein
VCVRVCDEEHSLTISHTTMITQSDHKVAGLINHLKSWSQKSVVKKLLGGLQGLEPRPVPHSWNEVSSSSTRA